jgi:hypothetical protein
MSEIIDVTDRSLRRLVNNLDQYSEHVDINTARIRNLEKMLINSPFRMAVTVIIEDSIMTFGTHGTLYWGKHEATGKWRLMFDGEIGCKPLLEWDTTTRQMLVNHLDHLMDEISSLIEDKLKDES